MQDLRSNSQFIKRLIFLSIASMMFVLLGVMHGSFTKKHMSSFRPSINKTEAIIQKRLTSKYNTFHLVKQTSIVPQAQASGEFDNASSYVVVDLANGNILAQKNSSEELPIASLTKIMSAVVALDLTAPSTLFSVQPDAEHIMPTKIGVKTGEKLTLDEALQAMLLTSANDAAQVVNDGINTEYGGNIFVHAMNEKAKILGLSHTHFTNPQGFDNPHNYSTARDLAVLSEYALTHYPLIGQTVSQNAGNLAANAYHPTFYLNNWNGLMGVYPDTIGMKIGNTYRAQYTSIVVSNRGGEELLAVVLGAPTIYDRDLWASELLDLGYENTLSLAPVGVTKAELERKYSTWKYW